MGVRHYTLRLTAVGPVHIGNGKTLGKKDYFEKGSKIAVIDAEAFVSSLNPQQLEDYLNFLSGTDSSQSLQGFLDRHHDIQVVANRSIAYTIDKELARTRRGNSYYEVAEFVKDVYGKPYVPGSSIKGMLRTAILAFVLDKNPERYARIYARIYNARRTQSGDKNKTKNACNDIERDVFKQEKPDPDDPEVTNDVMRYISVSDSAPFSTDDLVFAKKYDKFSKQDGGYHKKNLGSVSNTDYRAGNELNIYRECLKPGVQFECSISIDERIDRFLDIGKLDADGIRRILQRAAEIYNERFLSHFELPDSEATGSGGAVRGDGQCRYIAESGPLAGMRCRNRAVDGTDFCNTHKDKAPDVASTSGNKTPSKPITCYLGGGVGFSSKTVVNALLPEPRQRADAIARTLYAQFPTKMDHNRHQDLWGKVRHAGFEPKRMNAQYRNRRLQKAKDDHRHWMDPKLGVSPHTVKLAIVGKKKYLMGACEIKVKE